MIGFWTEDMHGELSYREDVMNGVHRLVIGSSKLSQGQKLESHHHALLSPEVKLIMAEIQEDERLKKSFIIFSGPRSRTVRALVHSKKWLRGY